jgi:carbon monoxide dehydrogenase subunit G
MELEHSFTVPVPEERAWNVLLDVERVAPCMPGATLTSVDGDLISGSIKVKVGPIAMTYAGTAHFTERDPDQHVITLEASGKETRGAGTASAKVRSTLEGQGDQTHVTVHTTLNVTGRPAQFGRGVMSEVGGKLIGIFAANLAEMLSADQPGGTTSDGAGSGRTNSGSAGSASAAAEDSTSADSAEPGRADAEGDLSAPLEELHLPARSYNSLSREGIHTVGELSARTEEQLLAMEGIGPASVQEIGQRLADRGLTLRRAPAGAGPGADSTAAAAASTTATSGAAGTARADGAAANAVPAPRQADAGDSINLLRVAGLPVLKRAGPVLAGLVAAALVVLRFRYRRRRRG